MASSGFRSMTQKHKRPPFNFTNIVARNEINGGDVSATTTSNGLNVSKQRLQERRKLANPSARLHLLFLPSDKEGMRMIVMFFQRSRRGKRVSGSS